MVDCMVALPGQLFYSTQIPACLWFLARDKERHARKQAARPARRGAVHRRAQARNLVDRTRKEFSDEDIARITPAYHAWRGESEAGEYADVPGFCRAAKLEEIRGTAMC